MAKEHSGVRFDHREMAVILSLFVFVSILMFTVGILVGKGISQHQIAAAPHTGTLASEEHASAHNIPSGTSVSTDHAGEHAGDHGHSKEAAEKHEGPGHAEDDHSGPPKVGITEGSHEDRQLAEAKSPEPLELVPAKPRSKDVRGELEEFPKTKEMIAALKNPKLQSLYEGSQTKKRETASVSAEVSAPSAPTRVPTSAAQGKYTVQVGSYPSQKEAEERVGALKKLGFPHAFFSAKELTKDTWYRVWLGYFPDAEAARQGGIVLQARGEVKNYIVRASDKKD
jgi:cell division protein FtsN